MSCGEGLPSTGTFMYPFHACVVLHGWGSNVRMAILSGGDYITVDLSLSLCVCVCV